LGRLRSGYPLCEETISAVLPSEFGGGAWERGPRRTRRLSRNPCRSKKSCYYSRTPMTQLGYGIGRSLQGIEDASSHHLIGLELDGAFSNDPSWSKCPDVSRGRSLGPVFRNHSSSSLAEVACGLHKKRTLLLVSLLISLLSPLLLFSPLQV